MKKVYLTVDTECHDIKKENIYVWGKKGDYEYGLKRIVDFAEVKSYGSGFIHRIIDEIE